MRVKNEKIMGLKKIKNQEKKKKSPNILAVTGPRKQ